jgi:protein-tyrosine phosphatase
MKFSRRTMLALALLCVAVPLAWHTARSASPPGITDVKCELIGPGVYRLEYRASPDAGAVKVFASAHPDRIDSAKPLATLVQSPAEVSVPASSGRVYFHLQPASGTTRVVSVRRLPLEGAANFRDLGGYRTTDGHYVRWGLVYRSGHLANLSAKDYEYLNSLGLRLVCDVRAEGERNRLPTQWTGRAPEFLSLQIGPDRDGTLAPEELEKKIAAAGAPGQSAVHGYEQYATEFAPQYGKILRRIAAGDLPIVEHCTSGKDRTGLFSAILLTALGVPRETVIQDYLLTSEYMLDAKNMAKTSADLQQIFGVAKPLDDAAVRAIMSTDAGTLTATLDSINAKYGSLDNYRREALQVSDADLALLRQRLLEP